MEKETRKNDINYINQYNKEFQRTFRLNVSRIYDADLIQWLEEKSSIQGYIKDLIRKDMESRKLAAAAHE